MNIDFSKAFESGASEEEIIAAMRETIERQKEQLEAQIHGAAEEHARKALEAKKIKDKEALKAEARACVINALLAYCEAYDLVDEPFTEDEIAEMEDMLKKVEDMIPLYVKLGRMQQELNKHMGKIDADDEDLDELNDFFKGLCD